eukprot:2292766-Pleurochrysis_carterae.AAC.4
MQPQSLCSVRRDSLPSKLSLALQAGEASSQTGRRTPPSASPPRVMMGSWKEDFTSTKWLKICANTSMSLSTVFCSSTSLEFCKAQRAVGLAHFDLCCLNNLKRQMHCEGLSGRVSGARPR